MTAAPILLLLAGLLAQDSVRVQAGLDRAEVRVGETAVLRVDVETGGDRAEIDRITRLPPGIELVGTRDYDQRQFRLPGGTRRFVTREFILRPRATGEFRIPAISVLVNGRRYATPSQQLSVAPPPPGLRDTPEANERGVALRAWLDRDTAYVGQQVTMQAEAIFSQAARMRLRRAPEYEAPSPAGFWIQDLPDQRTATTRIADGDVYEVQGFRRAFFPLSPGAQAVPPARLEYEMRRGILYAPETFEVVTDPMPLVVLPVPATGRPPEYTGAVGRFTVRGSIEPSDVPAGEAAVLTVEVEGTGNVKGLPPPQLPPLEGVEVFPPSEEAETRVDGDRVGGSKRFSWVLIPREPGTLEIPPVRYAFFDPEAERFETAELPDLTLRVSPGTGMAPSPAATSTLRYVKTEPSPTDPLGWVSTPWFALAQLLPLLALAAGWSAGRRSGGRTSRREMRRARRAAVRDLERRAAAGDAAFLAEAESFARGWIAERIGVRPLDASRKAALAAAGTPEGTATSVARALDRLAAARYAPTPPGREAMKSMAGQLAAALDRLDRDAPPPRSTEPRSGEAPARARAGDRRGRAIGITLLVATAAAALAAPPATAQTDAAAEPFRRGLTLFDAQRFGEAADAFRAHVAVHPRDPAGWYNLGTAHYRAGEPGHAVWAWLHVPPLSPRDADTRHNLRAAGVPPELIQRVAPPVPLRPPEIALLASVAWLIAGGAGALALSRRRRGLARVAGVALLVAVLTGALWLASTRGRETLIVLETATLRAGPTLGGEPLEELEPGAGVVPVATHRDWRRVRTLGGGEGWIENRSVGAL